MKVHNSHSTADGHLGTFLRFRSIHMTEFSYQNISDIYFNVSQNNSLIFGYFSTVALSRKYTIIEKFTHFDIKICTLCKFLHNNDARTQRLSLRRYKTKQMSQSS